MPVHGVDISRYQADYAPGPDDHFVIVKASEGRTVRNEHHDAQVARVRAAGRIVGHYHWLWPGNIAAQLDKFALEAKVKPGDIIALDWENTPSEPTGWPSVADVEAWVRGAMARWPQNRVIVYSYSFYPPFMLSEGKVFLGHGLWIADYRSTPLGDIPGNLSWVIHQYSDKPIDQNRADFDYPAAMRAWANFTTLEDDVITDTDVERIAAAVTTKLAGDRGFLKAVATMVWTLDGIIDNDKGQFAPVASAGLHVTPESAIESINDNVRSLL